MRYARPLWCKFILNAFTLLTLANCAHAEENNTTSFPLSDQWQIQDSQKTRDSGEVISRPDFRPSQWHPARVPSTVFANLAANKPSFDPFYSKNLEQMGTVPAYQDDPNAPHHHAPYNRGWWYRKEFTLSPSSIGQQIELNLRGINYSAEIWLNGNKVAGPDTVIGMYRTFSLDLTPYVVVGGKNTLALKINPPKREDLISSWVDWAPTPADQNMGIWREAYLTFHQGVTVKNAQVITHFNDSSLRLAQLTVEANLKNTLAKPIEGIVSGTFDRVSFQKSVKLLPGEESTVSFDPADYPQLNLKNPKVWWPSQMGMPTLHALKIGFSTSAGVSDQTSIQFGIREVTSELTADHSRLYQINGKPILIRGGGWASDLFLRFSKERILKELRMVQELNLNTLRLEGTVQPEYFYEMTDRLGILVMPGLVCCNGWQFNQQAKWTPADSVIAQKSVQDQLTELRSHPSVFTFLYGSDEAPSPAVEQLYLDAADTAHFTDPLLSSAQNVTTPLTGESGVKMFGPYEYVGPSYWYQDKKNGGAFGFSTEISPGPAIPPIESLKQFIPTDHLWPIDEVWSYHAGKNHFSLPTIFTDALEKRYDLIRHDSPLHSVEEYAMKSQAMAYDGERAMFEAYSRNKYHSATGVIQWMLNNPWPSIYWHLYDYYLRAGGGYYGVKKANEPIHIQYSYDDDSIVIVNSTYEAQANLTAKISVYDFSMKKLYGNELPSVALEPDSTKSLLTLPSGLPLSDTYFVKLVLTNANDQTVSDNFYWLSTQKEILSTKPEDTTWYTTKMEQEADLTELNRLAPAQVKMDTHLKKAKHQVSVTLKNTGKTLAFMAHLKLVNKNTREEILPSFWSDNYFSLLPDEKREITVQSMGEDVQSLEVELEGWNF